MRGDGTGGPSVDEAGSPRCSGDRGGSGSLAWRLDRHAQIVHVVDHGNEQVEEQLTAVLHLVLHCAAALESVARTDDQCEVVRTKLGVVVGCVGVGVTSRGQDRRALDARLQPLFAKSQLLELLEPVLLSLAVDHSVLQDGSCRRVDHCLVGAVVVTTVLKGPGVALLVELKARVVVTLVQVLEDRRENLGLLLREVNALVGSLVELSTARGLEVRRVRQNVLVSREKTLLSSDAYCDDGADDLSVMVLHFEWRCVLTFPAMGMQRSTKEPERLVEPAGPASPPSSTIGLSRAVLCASMCLSCAWRHSPSWGGSSRRSPFSILIQT